MEEGKTTSGSRSTILCCLQNSCSVQSGLTLNLVILAHDLIIKS